jgi:hypothetical protein
MPLCLSDCAFYIGFPASINSSRPQAATFKHNAQVALAQYRRGDSFHQLRVLFITTVMVTHIMLFCRGATEGLKMVGEFFPWTAASSSSSSASSFVYTQANHKSVLGIGAYAKRAGGLLYMFNLSSSVPCMIYRSETPAQRAITLEPAAANPHTSSTLHTCLTTNCPMLMCVCLLSMQVLSCTA